MTGRKAKGSCPIWAQGKVRGETVRQSLDIPNWEAAQRRVRDWEIDGRESTISLADAYVRFISQHEANGHVVATIELMNKLLIHRRASPEKTSYFYF